MWAATRTSRASTWRSRDWRMPAVAEPLVTPLGGGQGRSSHVMRLANRAWRGGAGEGRWASARTWTRLMAAADVFVPPDDLRARVAGRRTRPPPPALPLAGDRDPRAGRSDRRRRGRDRDRARPRLDRSGPGAAGWGTRSSARGWARWRASGCWLRERALVRAVLRALRAARSRNGMMSPVERVAVIDMGSNSFRLVVFQYEPGSRWALADEIREATRVSAGHGRRGRAPPEPMDRARAHGRGLLLLPRGARASSAWTRWPRAQSATPRTATSC